MKIIFFIFVLITVLSCKRSNQKDCPPFIGLQVPNSLFFVLKTNGQRLSDNILNSLRLYYYHNNQKFYLSDFIRAINEGGFNGYDLGILTTREIGLRSGNENIKDFYLEFANGDIDTLYVDYRRYSQCEADTSACYCLFPRIQVKYNGQMVHNDPTITLQTVYLFNKP